jgi:multiple sugar transport system substrate-binding protein
VTDSAEYKAMQPQATYAKLTANGIFDPRSKFAGVASPLFEAAGNAFTPALNGEKSAKDAAAEMVSTMNALK